MGEVKEVEFLDFVELCGYPNLFLKVHDSMILFSTSIVAGGEFHPFSFTYICVIYLSGSLLFCSSKYCFVRIL
jgi:hypothetical protein